MVPLQGSYPERAYKATEGHRQVGRVPLGQDGHSRQGLKKHIRRVKAPTLLVWGKDDRVVPPVYAHEGVRSGHGGLT